MFGAIVEVTMKTAANVHMDMETLQLSSAEFPQIYHEILKESVDDLLESNLPPREQEEKQRNKQENKQKTRTTRTVEMKIARLNITNLDDIDVFVFRRSMGGGDGASGGAGAGAGGNGGFLTTAVSRLPRQPVGMNWKTAILYKWIMPTMRGDIIIIIIICNYYYYYLLFLLLL